jgi:hypothetical protein
MKTRNILFVIVAVAVIAGAVLLLFVFTPSGSPKYPEVEKYLQKVPTAKGWKLVQQQSFAPSGSSKGNVFELAVEKFRKPDTQQGRGHYLYDANGTSILVVAYHDGATTKRIDVVSYLGSSCPPMDSLRDDLKQQFPGVPCQVVFRYKP